MRELDEAKKRVVRVPRWKGLVRDKAGRRRDRDDIEGRLLGGSRVGRRGGWRGRVEVGEGGEGGQGGQVVEFVSGASGGL